MLEDSVVGHELARRFFDNVMAAQRLSHAYLLVGPEGVGKRSFANALVAGFLCKRPQEMGEPCGACASCQAFLHANHPAVDVIEPLPGKSIEIDQIRGLAARLAVRGEDHRFLIVDNADRLAVPSANALLKTLEEPPEGIVFLLITGRPAHLLDTIHSRCHRVPFATLTEPEFGVVLNRRGVEGEVVDTLYRMTGGSPGSALSLFEAIEQCGGFERLQDLLNGVGAERPETLIEYLPALGDETKRDRTRRLLRLLLDAMWGERSDDPAVREKQAERVIKIAALERDLQGYQNAELILEEVAGVIRRP